MAKYKYYVVWKGRETGVFDTWVECKDQTEGYLNAQYKAYGTRIEAEAAFNRSYEDRYKTSFAQNACEKVHNSNTHLPLLESVSVCGTWNAVTGKIMYQGVYTKTKNVLFKAGPFEDGIQNIAEFLAIVEALKYCKSKGLSIPIYSHSQTALSWIRNKKIKSSHARRNSNRELYQLFDDALDWIKQNDFDNKILKWETKFWGENPADFGRK